MILSKLSLSAFFLSIPAFIAGCSAEHLGVSELGALSTYKEELGAKQQKFHAKSLLLVGLESYLGRETTYAKSAQ